MKKQVDKFTYLKVDVKNDSLDTIRQKRHLLTSQVRDLLIDYKFMELHLMLTELSDTQREIDDELPKKIHTFINYREREMMYYLYMLRFASDIINNKILFTCLSEELTDVELCVLAITYREKEMTIARAVEISGYSRSTISKAFLMMCKSGLMLSVTEPENNNRNVYSLGIRGVQFMDFLHGAGERSDRLREELENNDRIVEMQRKIAENKFYKAD